MPQSWRRLLIKRCASVSPILGKRYFRASSRRRRRSARFQKAEIEKWWPIIKEAGIKPAELRKRRNVLTKASW